MSAVENMGRANNWASRSEYSLMLLFNILAELGKEIMVLRLGF